MKFLKDLDVSNKRVLVRADFNVARDRSGKIADPFRIEAIAPTLKFLLEKKAKIILISHWGQPKNRELEWSLAYLRSYLEKVVSQKVNFFAQTIGPAVQKEITKLNPGEILLLENLRFYPAEEKNDPQFVQELAKLGDFFVQEAFATLHREHASIVSLPKFLPSAAGLLLEKEISFLNQAIRNPARPLTVIMGGAKVASKIKYVNHFLKEADNLILGGVLANAILFAKGLTIGKSLTDHADLKDIKNLEITSSKFHLPIDVVTSSDTTGAKPIKIVGVGSVPKDELILDIGPDSQELFSQIIKKTRTVIWNGPLGLFEVEQFSRGTKAIALVLAQSSAYSIVGGGETAALLHKMGLFERISHVSTGGGSMMEFLAGEELPGLIALQ